jgi:hypothetical protein
MTIPSNTWCFQPGEHAYVRGWPQTETALILAQCEFLNWPHYIVSDWNGDEWRISQLELSSRPIPNCYS